MQPARSLLTWFSAVFVAALAVQFFLAGAGAFGAASWDVHSAVGFFLVLGSLVIVVVAGFARRLLLPAIVLFVLMLGQMLLARPGAEASAWIGALHALNALAVFGVAMMIVVRSRRDNVPPA